MSFLILALRNIQSNRRRAATIAIFVFVSVLVFLLLNSAVTTAQSKVDNAVINSLLGHTQIRPEVDEPTAVIDMSADWGAPEHLTAQQTSDAISAAMDSQYVAAVHPIVRTNMLVAGPDFDPAAAPGTASGAQVPTVAIGVEEGSHQYEQNLVLDEGSFLQFDDPYEVVLAASVAQQLDVAAGDTVTLIGAAGDGAPVTTLEARVVGVGDAQSLSGFEARLCYLTFDAAAQIKGLADGQSSEVVAFAERKDQSQALTDEVAVSLDGDYRVTDWSTQGGYISAINVAYTGVFYIFLFIILLISCILIINMISLTALERTAEVATLRAIGFDRARIVIVFMVEVLGAALVGAISAYLLAAAIGLPLSTVTFTTGPPVDAVVGQEFQLGYDLLAGLPGVGLILALVALASLRPSLRAASRNAAEALIDE